MLQKLTTVLVENLPPAVLFARQLNAMNLEVSQKRNEIHGGIDIYFGWSQFEWKNKLSGKISSLHEILMKLHG